MKPYLKSLSLKNFRSFHGEHHVPRFPEGMCYVNAVNHDQKFGSNGGGKSTLLGALAWAIYGNTSTGVAKDSLISWGQDEMAVELCCGDFRITRTKSRGRQGYEMLNFYHPSTGERGGRGDLVETQAVLENMLNLPRNVFFASSWIDREAGAMQLLLAKPTPRLRIMQEVFSEDRYRALAEAANKGRKAASQTHQEALRVLEGLRRSTKELDYTIEGLEQKIHAERERSLSRHRERRLAIETPLIALRHEMGVLRREERDRVDTFPVAARSSAVQHGIVRMEAELRSLAERLSAPMVVEGSVCPTCQQTVKTTSAGVLARERVKWSAERARVEQDLAKARALLAEAMQKEAELNAIVARLSEAEQKASRLQRELEALGDEPQEDTIRVLEEQLELARGRRDDLRLRAASSHIYADILHGKVEDHEFWQEAFGPRGIPNLLLDQMRAFLKHHTAPYLHALAGFGYGIDFPPSDTGFDVALRTSGGDVDPMALSGGERWRVNLALILSFRKALASMYPNGVDFCVLDDVYSALDEEGEAHVQELAEELCKEVSHVFIAVPRSPERNFGNRIEIEKRHGISRVVGVYS